MKSTESTTPQPIGEASAPAPRPRMSVRQTFAALQHRNFNLWFRGQIISLMDLRILFALPEKGLTDLNRVIVITNGKITFGILADNISGMGTIPSYLILTPDPAMMPPWKRYLKGYVGNSLIMLDAGAVLADPALIVED